MSRAKLANIIKPSLLASSAGLFSIALTASPAFGAGPNQHRDAYQLYASAKHYGGANISYQGSNRHSLVKRSRRLVRSANHFNDTLHRQTFHPLAIPLKRAAARFAENAQRLGQDLEYNNLGAHQAQNRIAKLKKNSRAIEKLMFIAPTRTRHLRSDWQEVKRSLASLGSYHWSSNHHYSQPRYNSHYSNSSHYNYSHPHQHNQHCVHSKNYNAGHYHGRPHYKKRGKQKHGKHRFKHSKHPKHENRHY